MLDILADNLQQIREVQAKKKLAKEFGVIPEDLDKVLGLIDNMDDAIDELRFKQDALTDADDAVTDAESELTDARQEEADAINAVSDAERHLENIRRIVGEGTQEYADALNNLNDATQKAANATRNREDAESKVGRAKDKRDEAQEAYDKADERKNRAEHGFRRKTGVNFDPSMVGKKSNFQAAMKAQKSSAVSKAANVMSAVSKGSFSKLGPWGMVADGIIKVVEFGIGKVTEYMKVGYENQLREMNAITAVQTNAMKANLASWADAMDGAYVSQSAQIESTSEITKAANEITLANLQLTNSWTNWIPIWGSLNKLEEENLKMRQAIAEADIANAGKIINQVTEFSKRTDDYLKKQDKAIRGFQAETGLSSSQTKSFESRMLIQAETFSKYNKTIEDVLKMQSSYFESTGRTTNFSNVDNEQMLAVGRVVGDDNATQFASEMQLFNHSVANSADIMYQMYRDVNKMGLSQKKVTKDVLSNLKLAQKYDFKNGTKGFIELAKWAENVRFNLGSLGNMLEKGQSQGLEGTMTQAAKLQVLGGNFAMGADPLAMMYESFSDPEAYAKRIKSMFKGLGTLDSETGETKFGEVDQMRIRAAAEALGMNVEDAKNMIREDNKKQVVKSQMRNSTLSNEQRDAVANKAQRDASTGRWYVNTVGGDKIDVNNVRSSDIGNILSDNQEERADQYAQSTLSVVEKIESATQQINAKLGVATFDNFTEVAEKNIQDMLDAYTNNLSKIAETISQQREDASNVQQELLENLNSILSKYNDSMLTISEAKKKSNEILAIIRAKLESQDNSQVDVKKSFVKAAESSGYGFRLGRSVRDSTVSANGQPMMVASSSVTPIQDGKLKLAKTDPQDSAIFAKVGGPFDNLFNGVFSQIDNVYNYLHDEANNSYAHSYNGSRQYERSQYQNSAIFAKVGGPLVSSNFKHIVSGLIQPQPIKTTLSDIPSSSSTSYNYTNFVSNGGGSSVSQNSSAMVKHSPIDVNIKGELNLKNNGQTIDIMKEIKSNPQLLRQLTQLISDEVSKNINGGKTLFSGGQIVGNIRN